MMSEEGAARFFFHSPVGLRSSSPASRAPLAFHERLPGYAPTPLHSGPELARLLGIREVLVKDESSRLGLPAFKILGASWAIYCALEKRRGAPFEEWQTIDELRAQLAPLLPLTLVAATDGNHGRAVAHMATLLGLESRIYVPSAMAPARMDGIASEGAQVTVVDGTYDDAVARSAEDASERRLVISDTSWPGYEEVPRHVMDGYSTIMWEIDDELARRGEEGPRLVAVQFGVGALAAAVVQHYRQPAREPQPIIVSVEPLRAACMLESMEAGELVSIPGPHDSIMAGLNCGSPSMVAWPIVSNGIDGFVAIPDKRARDSMRALARAGIVAGETGGAGLSGLIELLTGPNAEDSRAALGVTEETRALVFVTEGATDPEAYRQITAGTAPV